MRFSFRAFILALTACVIVIAAKNIWSCELSSQIDKGIYRASKHDLIEKLYMGSSMFRQGIDVNEAARDSDSIFIIAYNGLDPANEKLILDFLIDSGLVIHSLYLDMYAYSASDEAWLAESRMLFDSPLSLKLKIWELLMQSERSNLLTTTYELFVSSGNDMFVFWPLYRTLAGNRYYRGGASQGSFSPGTTREVLDKMPVPDKGSRTMHKTQKAALHDIIKTCREHEINLVFIETPKYAKTLRSRIYTDIMSEYLDLLRSNDAKCIVSSELLSQTGNHDGGNVSGYEFSHEDAGLFADQVHLSRAGSKIFTRLLQSCQSKYHTD